MWAGRSFHRHSALVPGVWAGESSTGIQRSRRTCGPTRFPPASSARAANVGRSGISTVVGHSRRECRLTRLSIGIRLSRPKHGRPDFCTGILLSRRRRGRPDFCTGIRLSRRKCGLAGISTGRSSRSHVRPLCSRVAAVNQLEHARAQGTRNPSRKVSARSFGAAIRALIRAGSLAGSGPHLPAVERSGTLPRPPGRIVHVAAPPLASAAFEPLRFHRARIKLIRALPPSTTVFRPAAQHSNQG